MEDNQFELIDVEQLLKDGESITLEFKESSGSISKDIWETYSAFANTYGGKILLGIHENTKEEMKKTKTKYTIVGMKNIQKRLKEFWDAMNGDKVSTNILMDRDVMAVKADDKDVLLIRVPVADYKKRPVYINGNPMKGTFRRNFEGDYHCTEEEIRAMIRDSSDVGIDGRLLPGSSMDDIDLESLQAYRNLFNAYKIGHPFSNLDNKGFLRNLGGYIFDRKTGEEGLTAAGLLMFGKGLSIREYYENLGMDYIDRSHLETGQRWSDRIAIDGTWENNLFQFATKVLAKITADLPKPFQLNGVIRTELDGVRQSVREALVNMIIHADYQIMGQLRVEKFEDGFLFSNPGNLKIPVTEIFKGECTASRNPKIAMMFRTIGFCENIGSGFPTILQAWNSENWRSPDLYNSLENRRVDLRLWMCETLPHQAKSKLFELYGQDYQSLSEDEQIVLASAALEGSVTPLRIQTLLKEDLEDIVDLLNKLTKEEYLLRKTTGKKQEYSVNDQYAKTVLSIIDLSEDQITETDEILINLLKSHGCVTNKMIIDSVSSINSLSGASKAMDKFVKKGIVFKEKEGRTILYKLVQA